MWHLFQRRNRRAIARRRSANRNRRPKSPCRGPETLEPRCLLAVGPLVISEINARNDAGLIDDLGNRSDWIEIYNPTTSSVSLDKWYLTNDAAKPTKWQFPALTMEAGAYLTVFATGLDHHDPAAPLHTSFKLDGDGNYLALVKPDGATISSDLGTDYPLQYPNMSFGRIQSFTTLVADAATAKFRVPTADDATWTTTTYNDAGWVSTVGGNPVKTGVGFDTSGVLAGSIRTSVDSAMRNINSSIWLRIPFTVSTLAGLDGLTLRMKYNDGFVAYLNGQEIARSNAPTGDPHWNSTATASRDNASSLAIQDFNAGKYLSRLAVGNNVLAIQGLNRTAADTNFLLAPQLVATATQNAWRYFASPTPGQPNGIGLAACGPLVRTASRNATPPAASSDLVITSQVAPTYSAVNQVTLRYRVMFGTEFSVAMLDNGLGSDAVAGDGVYTAVIPHAASGSYTGYTAGQMVRWYITATSANGTTRAPFYSNAAESQQYFGTVVADPSVATSQLPVVYWFVQNPGAAATETGTPSSFYYSGQFCDNINVNLHGQSTAGFNKKSYNFELNSEARLNWSSDAPALKDFKLLTNWADKSKVRNTLAWETERDAGVPWLATFPVRVQQNGLFFSVADFMENADGHWLERMGLDPNGPLYKIYNSLESTAGAERKTGDPTDMAPLQTLVNAGAMTGDAQTRWLYDNVDFAQTANMLASLVITSDGDFGHKNYFAYLDSNGTALWHFYPWDVDLTFGHNWTSQLNYFDDAIYTTNGLYVGSWNKIFGPLYNIPAFKQMYLRRIRSLMDQFLQPPGTPAANQKFEARINQLVAQIDPHNDTNPALGTDDADLDYQKWGSWGNMNTTRQGADRIKNEFLPARRSFLYSNGEIPTAQKDLATLPANQRNVVISSVEYAPASGNQDEEYFKIINNNSFALDISGWKIKDAVDIKFEPGTVIPAGGTLYVSPNVVAFRHRTSGPSGNQSLLVAGNYQGHLSSFGETITLEDASGDAIVSLTYAGNPTGPQQFLRITELNYAPMPADTARGELNLPASEFEYIELLNTGTQPLTITGVQFTQGITFTCPTAVLQSGQYGLVVKNQDAFVSRYGAGLNILGTYSGSLDNNGESIRLDDALSGRINAFTYDTSGAWPGRADGLGSSLEVINTSGDYDDPDNWRSSTEYNGSPGRAGLGPASSVLINEVLAHTDPPLYDSIELYNPTAGPIALGGWYLSDSTDNYKKFRIPDGTLLASGEYAVFDSRSFDVVPFASATEGLGGTWLAEDLGATIHLTGNGWKRISLPRPITANSVLEFDFKSTVGGDIQGIGVASGDNLNYNSIFRLCGGEAQGRSQYATYTGTDWVHFTIPLAEFATAGMDGLVFANDADDQNPSTAECFFRNVTVREQGVSEQAVNFNNFFGLNAAHGDDVYLVEADTSGNIVAFTDHVDFGAMANGESYGRWQDDQGNWHFYPMRQRTLGAANSAAGNGPRAGPLVISEVMYAPKPYASGVPLSTSEINAGFTSLDEMEYIEIYNPTASAVSLAHWTLAGGVDYAFADTLTVPARKAILVVSFSPANTSMLNAFRGTSSTNPGRYNCYTATVVGPYTGHLSDSGETIKLLRGDTPPTDEPTFYPGLVEDEVDYVSAMGAASDGKSLSRMAIDSWGLNRGSWAAGSTSASVYGQVAGRYVFYNNSTLDGKTTGASASDDNAIATNKQALLPGQTASFANYTSYVRGVNGVMVDFIGGSGIASSDFTFRAGNSSDLSGWTALTSSTVPAAPSVSTRSLANGATRVTILWSDDAKAPKNQWLEVKVNATSRTGLPVADVFYFGNAIAETGNNSTGSGADAVVDAADEAAVRAHNTATPAPADNAYDFNRDRRVNALDELLARANYREGASALALLDLTGYSEAAAAGEAAMPLAMAAGIQAAAPSPQDSLPGAQTAAAAAAIGVPPEKPAAVDVPLPPHAPAPRAQPEQGHATARPLVPDSDPAAGRRVPRAAIHAAVWQWFGELHQARTAKKPVLPERTLGCLLARFGR